MTSESKKPSLPARIFFKKELEELDRWRALTEELLEAELSPEITWTLNHLKRSVDSGVKDSRSSLLIESVQVMTANNLAFLEDRVKTQLEQSYSRMRDLEGLVPAKDCGLNYSQALTMMKFGKRVSREYWKEPNMWVSMGSEETRTVQENNLWSPHHRSYARDNGGTAKVSPYMSLMNVGIITMGWVANTEDTFATDWFVVYD